jgi:hypothetical protein
VVRCDLIHLLRDINEDVLKEPFNVELEELAHGFARLLRPMVATVDRFGLKAYHLHRHKLAVERFYRALSGRDYKTGPCCTDQSGWGLGPGSVEDGPALRERDFAVAGRG